MKYLFVGYKGCSTCTKAEKHLKENNIDYDRREIVDEIPTVSELKKWHELSGLDLKSFFNTRGGSYRELNLKETYDTLSDEERYDLLSKDGMLLKRPILVGDDVVLLGYKKEAYDKLS